MVDAIGKLDEFNPANDSITAYVERAQLYMEANSVPEDKKVAVFLSAIGGKTYSLLRNLLTPTLPKEKTFEQIVTVLKNHFEPKLLEIVEHFNFNRKQQGPEETVSQYVAELHRLSTYCNYGAFLNAALRDRFVCGLKSEATQKKRLTESDLTFTRAVEIALSMEAATTNTKQMHSSSTPSASVQKPAKVCKVKSSSQKKEASFRCCRCGNPDHRPSHCPFKQAKCHNCGGIGHIRPVCKKPKNPPQRKTWKPEWRGHVALVAQEAEPESCDLALNHVRADSGKPYTVEVKLNRKPTTMEVDTGASVSLMAEDTFKSHLPHIQLEPSSAKLVTYSQEKLHTRGQVSLNVAYGDQEASMPLVVLSESGLSLFGRNWLSEIRLDWGSINLFQDRTLDEVLEKYSDIFKSELGTLKGFEAKIYVDADAQPHYCKAHTVPYTLRGMWKKNFSDWKLKASLNLYNFPNGLLL